jgi:hypothetical protein
MVDHRNEAFHHVRFDLHVLFQALLQSCNICTLYLRYNPLIQQLLDEDKAYKCYMTEEELEKEREDQIARGRIRLILRHTESN